MQLLEDGFERGDQRVILGFVVSHPVAKAQLNDLLRLPRPAQRVAAISLAWVAATAPVKDHHNRLFRGLAGQRGHRVRLQRRIGIRHAHHHLAAHRGSVRFIRCRLLRGTFGRHKSGGRAARYRPAQELAVAQPQRRCDLQPVAVGQQLVGRGQPARTQTARQAAAIFRSQLLYRFKDGRERWLAFPLMLF